MPADLPTATTAAFCRSAQNHHHLYVDIIHFKIFSQKLWDLTMSACCERQGDRYSSGGGRVVHFCQAVLFFAQTRHRINWLELFLGKNNMMFY
jgi:hypothetical protein